MKNKIFISVVLAVILAATMSVGCFATNTVEFEVEGYVESTEGIFAVLGAYDLKLTHYNDYHTTGHKFTIDPPDIPPTTASQSQISFTLKSVPYSYSDAYSVYSYVSSINPSVTLESIIKMYVNLYDSEATLIDSGSHTWSDEQVSLNYLNLLSYNKIYYYDVDMGSRHMPNYYGEKSECLIQTTDSNYVAAFYH